MSEAGRSIGWRGRGFGGAGELTALGVVGVVFFVCCGLPLIWMIVALVSTPGVTGALHPAWFHLRLLERTLVYNIAVACLATLLGIPAAVVLGKGRGVMAGIFAFALPAALLLPSLVYAYGWMQLLRVGNVYPMPGSIGDVWRCIWTLATWLWPIPAGVIGLSLRRLDGDLQQQALMDGAYWRVVARQLARPALGAFAIVAMLAMQEFSVYAPTGISVVATEVQTVFETGQVGLATGTGAGLTAPQSGSFETADQRKNAAAALMTGLPLIAVIALLSAVAFRLGGGSEGEGAVDEPAKLRALRARWPVTVAALGVYAIAFLLPLVMLFASRRRPFELERMWRTFSPPILGTLAVGAVSGGVGVCVGALGLVGRFRWALMTGLVTFLIGGQMLAIALIRLYNRPGLDNGWIYDGPGIVVMAYVARFGWLAMSASGTTWTRRWRDVRDMASVDGAGAVAAARHVIWPMIWPLVAASGVLLMLLSMTELPATVLLNPLRPQVFIPQLMTWVHTLRSDDMLEASLLLAGMVVVLAAVVVGLGLLARERRASLRGAAKRFVIVLVALMLVGCSRGGKPEAVWLETGAGEGQVVYPRGICYDKLDDSYFVVDRLARIQHLDHNGRFIAGWKMPAMARGRPVGLTFGPDGNLWVPDTHYSRVMVFTPAGEKLKEFGSYGREKGQFIYPCDIAFDARGRVYVSEFGDHDRIQVFDKDLKYLFEFGRFGAEDGEFSRPQSMLIDGDRLYVTDACNHRIEVFTTEGRFIRKMGRVGSGPGEFRFPYGLDMDSKGRLVVCEFGNNRVQLIDKETGKGLGSWGSGGRELGELAYPWGVAVDKDDRVVAVDAGNNRLQVFEF